MPRITRVDIPAVECAIAKLEAIADRFESAHAHREDTFRLLEDWWGDDEWGEKFGPKYRQLADPTLENSKTTVENLRGVVANLRKIVQLMQNLDSASGGVLELVEK